MKVALVAVASFVSVAAGACAGPGSESTFAIRPSSSTPSPSTTCPFGIRGARITMSDTDDGVAFAVRAYGDVGEVRRRAHDAAAMYGPGAHRGLGHDGAHGGGQRHGLGLAHLGVPVEAEARDTPEGALIVVRPKVASDLHAMRTALAEREGHVRRGECP